jgi:hypothetical protein
MQVMLQLRPDAAREAHARHATARGPREVSKLLAPLLSEVAKHHAILTPVHPGATDLGLIPHFFVEVPDEAAGWRLIAALKQLEVVEGAYPGPRSEAP